MQADQCLSPEPKAHKVICSIKGLSLGSKNYTKGLKTVKCTSFLDQTTGVGRFRILGAKV